MSTGHITAREERAPGTGPSRLVRAETVLGGGERSHRSFVAAGAALALVALVAALCAGLPDRVRSQTGGVSAHALLSGAAAVALVLTAAGLVLALLDLRPRARSERAAAAPRRRWRPDLPELSARTLLAAVALVALSTLLLGLGALVSGSQRAAGGPRSSASSPSPAGTHAVHQASAANVSVDGLVFVVTAVLALVAVSVLALRAWRHRRPSAAREDAAGALDAAIEESLEDLAHEGDARRAVIRAYDRMERALAARGLARERAETPIEYLQRALAAVHASQGSIRRLTSLFELARFSRHRIDASMAHDAIAALGALRAELAAAAAPQGGAG